MDNSAFPNSLTVIMPAYNEQEGIAAAVAEVRDDVLNRWPASELLVVDDGSRDSTGKILDELSAADPRVRVIHKPNGGHAPALRTGLDAARSDWILLVDADRQIPANAIELLNAAAEGRSWNVDEASLAYCGVRLNRDDPKTRIILSRFIASAIRVLLGVRLRDANVPFKLFPRQLWLQASEYVPPETLAPSLFLAVYLKRRGKLVEVEVPHRRRLTGVPSIKRWRLIKFCARALRQLVHLRAKLK